MNVVVLGCGTSSGVPVIGCRCAVCRSDDPRNRRRRCSLYVEAAGQRILFDTSPDLRLQALDAGIEGLDAVVFTHAHADHVHGIDDLRAINFRVDRAIDAYGHPEVLGQIEARFAYAFRQPQPELGWWRPALAARPVEGPFRIGPLELVPIRLQHGRSASWGFRIGALAYCPDVHAIPEDSLALLEGLDIWIVDCLRDRPHVSHAHLERTLSWVRDLRPRLAVLTHMNHEVDYARWQAMLPGGVVPAHDGMRFRLGDGT